MHPIASAVLNTGLIDPALLDEMRRWGLHIELPEVSATPKTLEEVSSRIQDALESEGYVLVRETDLTVLEQYTQTAARGLVHLVFDDDDANPQDTTFPVSFGRTPLNEYILPWTSATIADVLVNGMTHLIDGQQHVYFKEVRELFFGDTKAFMICTPSFFEPIKAVASKPAEDPHHDPS
jgi:hypothetical protein